MINRVLLRIKAVQTLYGMVERCDNDILQGYNELQFSVEKGRDLYYYLLQLMVEVVKAEALAVDLRQNRFIKGGEEETSLRLVNNRFVKKLEANEVFRNYIDANAINWSEHPDFLNSIKKTILASDVYKKYLKSEDNFDSDKLFWIDVLKLWSESVVMEEELEDMSLFWNDDFDIIVSFLKKGVKKFTEDQPDSKPLIDKELDKEDMDFVKLVLEKAFSKGDEIKEMVSNIAENWSVERIVDMDMIILRLAIAEIMYCPSIAPQVTMNEYIEIAKRYSTYKSGKFINGVLNKVVIELKKEQKIFK